MQLFLLTLASLAAAVPAQEWDHEDEAAIQHLTSLTHVDLQITLLEGEEDIADDPEETEVLSSAPDPVGDLPDAVYVPDMGIMHPVIHQGFKCGSCGWVSGTQSLESRMAFVSENYIPYSIQNLMNCDEMVCKAQQPYHVNAVARKHPEWLVREEESPYVMKRCKTADPPCPCVTSSRNYTRVFDEQFAFIGPSVNARSEEEVLRALQEGSVTTCLNFNNKKAKEETGERCRSGCGHANSIIGYNKDYIFMQESWGKGYGRFHNGTWPSARGSACATNLLNKGWYPKIFYDYDRANAYFTETTVTEAELSFVDKATYGITAATTRNMGVTKNKCAYLGSACKGVVALQSGAFELVADFGAGSPGGQTAFRKTQMVVYLKEETGKYVGLDFKKKRLTVVDKARAAPFFTSHNRFISFEFPQYHIVTNRLRLLTEDPRDIDVMEAWSLKDCNLHSTTSGLSLDLVDDQFYGKGMGGSPFDKASTSQRFDIGLSGEWLLKSRELGLPLRREKNKQRLRHIFSEESRPEDKKPYYVTYFRWNARQIMTSFRGNPLDHQTMQFSDKLWEFAGITENAITPTDCAVSKLVGVDGAANHLAIKKGKVVMSTEMSRGRWTFEYGDL